MPGFSRHFRFATGFSRWTSGKAIRQPALAGLLLSARKARLKPAGEFIRINHRLKPVAKRECRKTGMSQDGNVD